MVQLSQISIFLEHHKLFHRVFGGGRSSRGWIRHAAISLRPGKPQLLNLNQGGCKGEPRGAQLRQYLGTTKKGHFSFLAISAT